jgi:GTP-binding protein
MDSWRFLINTYLQSVYIQRALCLFDCEHGLKTTDIQLLKMLDKLMKNYMIVGTKSDKKDVDRE